MALSRSFLTPSPVAYWTPRVAGDAYPTVARGLVHRRDARCVLRRAGPLLEGIGQRLAGSRSLRGTPRLARRRRARRTLAACDAYGRFRRRPRGRAARDRRRLGARGGPGVVRGR